MTNRERAEKLAMVLGEAMAERDGRFFLVGPLSIDAITSALDAAQADAFEEAASYVQLKKRTIQAIEHVPNDVRAAAAKVTCDDLETSMLVRAAALRGKP